VTVFAIAIVLTGAAMSMVLLASWRRRLDVMELGTMSEHWLAEHHAHDRSYSER
jgi:hypothetical protein